jgi:hypothetical protein
MGAPVTAQITYTGRNGANLAYCGVPGSGPLVDHRFLTIDPTDDSISVSDPGGGTLAPSAATSHLIASPSPSGLLLADSGHSMRGTGGGVNATADGRDSWEFTLASAACFRLTVTLNAASTEATAATQAFNLIAMGGGSIILAGGGSVMTLTHALQAPGTWTMTYEGTLQPGQYAITLAGRCEGNQFPYEGSFSNSLALSVGAPTIAGTINSAVACPGGTALFAVNASGGGPRTYQWQIQTAPGMWQTLGNDPFPLPCGGGAFAFASMPFASQTPIGVQPCPGVSSYQIRCIVSNPCGSATSNEATFTLRPGGYANCDGSTTQPVLNVNDFTCFLNQFAAGDSRANCDHSTAVPVLNVNDFTCFLNGFAVGCP